MSEPTEFAEPGPMADARRVRVRRVAGAGVLAAVGALVLVGCTSSSKHTPSSSSPSSSGSPSSSVSASSDAPTVSASSSASETDRATGSPSKASPNPALKSATAVQTTAAPIPIKSTGNFGGKVTGSIVAVKAVNAKAVQPGEVSGPGLAITIKLVNGSASAINLNNAVVNLAYGAAAAPGGPMTGPPAQPLPQVLAAGKSATAVYVFTTTKAGQTGPISIQVSYSPLAPIVVFSGSA